MTLTADTVIGWLTTYLAEVFIMSHDDSLPELTNLVNRCSLERLSQMGLEPKQIG